MGALIGIVIIGAFGYLGLRLNKERAKQQQAQIGYTQDETLQPGELVAPSNPDYVPHLGLPIFNPANPTPQTLPLRNGLELPPPIEQDSGSSTRRMLL